MADGSLRRPWRSAVRLDLGRSDRRALIREDHFSRKRSAVIGVQERLDRRHVFEARRDRNVALSRPGSMRCEPVRRQALADDEAEASEAAKKFFHLILKCKVVGVLRINVVRASSR